MPEHFPPLVNEEQFRALYEHNVYTTLTMRETDNGEWELLVLDHFKVPQGRMFTNQRIANYWFNQTRRRAAARVAMQAFGLDKKDTVKIRRPPDFKLGGSGCPNCGHHHPPDGICLN